LNAGCRQGRQAAASSEWCANSPHNREQLRIHAICRFGQLTGDDARLTPDTNRIVGKEERSSCGWAEFAGRDQRVNGFARYT
jgi:hypothetical protein